MRLFVAVWPPPEVVASLAGADRPEVAGVRWTTESQWHVTLRFLGEVGDPALVARRLRAAPPTPATAVIGPVSECLGRAVLCLPVTGLDAVAASVVEATADVGEAPEDRPFFGHLTLARARRGAHPAALRRLPPVHVSGAWPVTEVTVVASRTGGSGSRYEVVERVPV